MGAIESQACPASQEPLMPDPQSVPPSLTPSEAAAVSAQTPPTRAGSVLQLHDPDLLPDGPPKPIEVAGRYLLLGEIGRGGMGAVLRGRDPELGRDLALKVLLAESAGRPDVVQRFREEA